MACASPFWIQRLQSRGVSFKKLKFLPFLLLRNDTICTKFICILSEYIHHVEKDHSLCQNSKLPSFTVILFSFSAVRWQSTNQCATWIPMSFSIELCSHVNHARRASASLWDCNAPATEPIIGSQLPKTGAVTVLRKSAVKLWKQHEMWKWLMLHNAENM